MEYTFSRLNQFHLNAYLGHSKVIFIPYVLLKLYLPILWNIVNMHPIHGQILENS